MASAPPFPNLETQSDYASLGHQTPFQVLGVSLDADEAAIKAQARKLKIQYHTDKAAGNGEIFKRVNLAEQLLLKPSKRADWLHVERAFKEMSRHQARSQSAGQQLSTDVQPEAAPKPKNYKVPSTIVAASATTAAAAAGGNGGGNDPRKMGGFGPQEKEPENDVDDTPKKSNRGVYAALAALAAIIAVAGGLYLGKDASNSIQGAKNDTPAKPDNTNPDIRCAAIAPEGKLANPNYVTKLSPEVDAERAQLLANANSRMDIPKSQDGCNHKITFTFNGYAVTQFIEGYEFNVSYRDYSPKDGQFASPYVITRMKDGSVFADGMCMTKEQSAIVLASLPELKSDIAISDGYLRNKHSALTCAP